MNKNIFTQKKELNLELKNKFGLLKKDKPVGLVKLSNKNLIVELRDGLVNLPVGFIIEVENVETEKLGKNIVATGKIQDNLLAGFDFIICDTELSAIKKYLENGVVPIISKSNSLKSILKEFNPATNEGNCYFYDNENKWSIYGAIIRYLENYKFPFDNKNLVKNVLDI